MKTKKNKIVLLINSLAGGGAEGVCVSIANTFASNGYKVDLIILNLNNEIYLNRLSKEINLIVLNVKHTRYSFLQLLIYLIKNKPKNIIVFSYELSAMLVILRSLFRLKITIVSRNISTLSRKIEFLKKQSFWERYVVKNLIYFCYQKIDHVINQCYAMKEDLLKVHPQLSNKSSVIYNPISSYISDYVSSNDIKNIKKDNYLLCVGRLERQKAFHYAIEGFARIKDKFPNLRLKILGKGSLEKELKQKASHLNLSDRIDFEGFQKNIIPYYLYAKATVLTSSVEGFPNNLLESITLGTPVVSFDCMCGPSEIIKEGINGYLVKNEDISDLENKLSLVIKSRFEVEKMSFTVQRFKLDKIFENYQKLLNSLC